MHGLLTAQHGDWFEGGEPLEMHIVGEAEFPTPQPVFLSVAQAVESDTEHGRSIERNAVLRQAGGNVGVVMLHRR